MQLGCLFTLKSANITSVLDDGNLHSKTDPKVGGIVGTSPFGRSNHPLDTSGTEPSGNEDTTIERSISSRLQQKDSYGAYSAVQTSCHAL